MNARCPRRLGFVLLALTALVPAAPRASSAQTGQPQGSSMGTLCQSAPYREFDFWIGEWDVRPTQAPATEPTRSTNVIERAHGGCVLVENWRTPDMSGQSLNIYDRTRGRWHQTWTDSYGQLHEYWGGLEGGNMVFHGSTPVRGAPAQRQTVRLTFLPQGPDRVRQVSESLQADGSWKPNYDLTYYRRTAGTAK